MWKFPIILFVPEHTQTFLITSILHQSGIFVRTDEPILTHPDHPKSIVCIRLHICVVHSVGLEKYIMACIHHNNVT
jgi:hypothetical protein